LKPLHKDIDNCIYTPAECVTWNSGNIDSLGICNGDKLPKIIWEIVNELGKIAGEDISKFNIDELLQICSLQEPVEINLVSILTLIKRNQVCLKDYIDALNEKVLELSGSKKAVVDLKCYASIDNYNLGFTREQLDQFVIDKLCNHEERITTLESKVLALEIADDVIPTVPDEKLITTCIDPSNKSVSDQVKTLATDYCEYKQEVGSESDISSSLANVPPKWLDPLFIAAVTSKYPDKTWIINPQNWAQVYSNHLLAMRYLEDQVSSILTTCCAPTCDKIKIGFTIISGENPDNYIVRFRPSDGTYIPEGFSDIGSTITFTDHNGIVAGPFIIDVTEEETDEFDLSLLDLSKPIIVSVNSKLSGNGIICEKCSSKSVDVATGCPVCEVIATGTKGGAGSVTITYQY
jgi:hypothetical protein